MRASLINILAFVSRPVVAIGGALVIGIVGVGLTWQLTRVVPSGEYTAAVLAPIQQDVLVTGTVTAAQSTELSFQTPGQIAAIHVAVGQHVDAGQTLVTLDDASQQAAVGQAQAALEVQQANLATLQSGTEPAQISIDQTTLAQANIALVNAVQSAYVSADDAVHSKADQVFNNPRTSSPTLDVDVPDGMLASQLITERVALEPLFTSWQEAMAATSTNPDVAATAESDLNAITDFLNNLATALAEVSPGGATSATTLTGYQATVAAARTEVAGALTAVTSADTAQKGAAGALTLADAGATPDQIAAQQAAVDAAAAAVASAQVAAEQTVMTAPISGTITAQNANIGETVAAGTPLISMIADGQFEANAEVSEDNIGAVSVGEPVTATFAAYPNTTFDATVTTVSPAATMTSGVPSYQMTVTFASDPRIVAGLTANLSITTATATSTLVVPQSAVISNNGADFVYVQGAKGSVETPVQTGIEDQTNDTVEITSGLSAGDEVLTFGASSSQ